MQENKKDYYKRLHKNAEGLTFGFAKSMRSTPTTAEAILWSCLRNRKLGEFKFRRQHPIAEFVADFYCPEKKLVVELDGSIHREKEQADNDRERTEVFEKMGIRVIRFTNLMIKNNLEKVFQTILIELKKR
jgi:very-short-patch-repair endonuclease